ncbi:MAG: cytidine/deoxycytidylate deaminase family protein [archaeon]|nr:MAG: cytidine/deoxycytidylate deaminase family protein [archaeon]
MVSPNNYKRPSWDEYFMKIAEMVGRRGTCDRGRNGAVIVKNKRILSTGYVGSPVGLPHCDEAGHQMKEVSGDDKKSMHCVRTTHAEQNAIAQAARFGMSIEGGTIYTKMTPCYTCAKMIINSGIKRVVCAKDYHASEDTKNVFKAAGIEMVIIDKDIEKYENQ